MKNCCENMKIKVVLGQKQSTLKCVRACMAGEGGQLVNDGVQTESLSKLQSLNNFNLQTHTAVHENLHFYVRFLGDLEVLRVAIQQLHYDAKLMKTYKMRFTGILLVVNVTTFSQNSDHSLVFYSLVDFRDSSP